MPKKKATVEVNHKELRILARRRRKDTSVLVVVYSESSSPTESVSNFEYLISAILH
jgi:hypothetical protein